MVEEVTAPGFNPCFCGTRARTALVLTDDRENGEFQSLFLWNSRPDAHGRHAAGVGDRVSILVFVELAPGLYRRL